MKTVADIMTRGVITLDGKDSLQLVKDILSLDRLRHFPVLNDGVVVGIVSQRDLYKASLAALLKHREPTPDTNLQHIAVREVMSHPPITTSPQTPIQEAARVMMEKKIGCLPVLDGPRLVGVVSETDMLKFLSNIP